MGRYLGQYDPIEQVESDSGVIAHAFPAEDDGPMCLYGTDFHTMTLDKGHEDLIIFLQGGGLCYSDLCLAIGTGGQTIPNIDILSDDFSLNPLADWSQVYVPYCDGSLFGGDTDIDDDGDGTVDRYHRGLKNLSAALDVAASVFPEPRRVFLAGSSGGGYGTMVGTLLARWTWPEAELMVFNDAGVGLGIDGDPSFIWKIIDEFEAEAILPASEPGLFDQGHLSPIIGWQLSEDPNLRVSAYSSANDYVISQMYLKVGNAEFENWLRAETGRLQAEWPNQYQFFITEGVEHTTLLGDPSGFVDPDSPYASVVDGLLGGMATTQVNGVTIGEWIENFIHNTSGWTSHSN